MIVSIGFLRPGQEIRIAPGTGFIPDPNVPESTDVRTDVVIAVDGGSALTATGTLLADCRADGSGVEVTGRMVERPTLTQLAMDLLIAAGREDLILH